MRTQFSWHTPSRYWFLCPDSPMPVPTWRDQRSTRAIANAFASELGRKGAELQANGPGKGPRSAGHNTPVTVAPTHTGAAPE